MSENLKLWSELERTDPKHTKDFTRGGGFKGTQIDPVWRMRRMTEIFGPVGKGWGYSELQHVITDGMVFIQLQVWYKVGDDVMLTGPQWGGTELFNKRSSGLVPNDEAFKMSTTDALGRCFLQIGLAADVYLGLYDDSKYREETAAKIAAKDDPALSPENLKALEDGIVSALPAIDTLDRLDAFWKGGVNDRIKEVKKIDKELATKLTGLFSQRKTELTPKKEEKKEAGPPDVAAARSKFKEVSAAIATASAALLPVIYHESKGILEEIGETSPEGKETLKRKFEERAKELKVTLTGEGDMARRTRLMSEVARIEKLLSATMSDTEVGKLNVEIGAVLDELQKVMQPVYDALMKRFDEKIKTFYPLT